MTESKKKVELPFKIVENEVSGGFIDSVHDNFIDGIDIANYHEDKYGSLDTPVLQSPFTERWVGGKSHRHVEVGTKKEERPEAWHLEFIPNGVKFYSNAYRSSPPAYWSRQGLAKRPLNIQNIKNSGLSLGNFSSNYEVVQTSGRRITNNLIVDGYEFGSPLTTQFIRLEDFELPQLNSITGSKSIFVEKFNSPGSKEESSRRSLDREGEEISPNITLPFRNHYLRKSHRNDLTKSTPQFGGSVHGTNRNTLIRASNVQRDNGFIVNSLPRTDIQYSWITASSDTTAEQLGGYQSFGNNYNRSEAFVDIDFITGSVISPEGTKILIDNNFINSKIKDKKTIDLDNRIVIIDSSLSASMSEYVNSPYTFTTWTSIRNADHLVAKNLRKNNILSIQDQVSSSVILKEGERVTFKGKHGDSAKNFKDPAVTFKYRPLRHKFIFVGNDTIDLSHDVVHTYANNISTFSNKDLLKRLGSEEDKGQFYDLLYNFYTNLEDIEDNPIQKFINYLYKETVWPREENTSLSKTRKRNAYYLNKPGFDRDGFDIKLGTQRVFWRNNFQDRKRSKNSSGGYYSSLGQLSTEETGSNFVQLKNGVLSDNKSVNLSSSFYISDNLDDGLFNSIILLEEKEQEKTIFNSTSSVTSLGSYTTFYGSEKKVYNSIVKRGYKFENLGEFDNIFLDFYEQINNDNLENKKSIGSLYRSTGYKSILTKPPEELDNFDQQIIKNEDEEIFTNPKLKYLAFIGGGELNTGSFIQNEDNFNNSTESRSSYIFGEIHTMLSHNNDIYVGGTFSQIGDLQVNNIAKWDGKKWNSLGEGLDTTVRTIIISGSDVYAGGTFTNYVSKWDGVEWSSAGEGLSGTGQFEGVYSLLLSGSDIYAGGKFGTGSVAKLNNSSWEDLGSELANISATVRSLVVHDGEIYAGGSIYYNNSHRGVMKWDGSNWNTMGSFSSTPTIYDLISSDSDGYLYAGGTPNLSYSDGTNWYLVDNSLLATVFSLLQVGNTIYAGTNANQHIYAWDSSIWSAVGKGLSDDVLSIIVSGSSIYAGGSFETTGSKIASSVITTQYENATWEQLEENVDYDTFTEKYLEQDFEKTDFIFSTMDSGLTKETHTVSNKSPFFDSYDDYIEDVRGKTKDYSTVPEFTISRHMNYYLEENSGNFRTKNNSFLTMDGQFTFNSSETEKSNYNNLFLKNYATSDLLKKHDLVRLQNESISKVENINLKVSGIKKLLPYNGFYPQERTVQIANLYSDYVNKNLHGGVYNLSYKNDFADNTAIATLLNDSYSLSVEKYLDKYYMAVLYEPSGTGTDQYGTIDIYSSSIEDPESWSSSPVKRFNGKSITNVASTYYKGASKLVSGTNGLNLFAYSTKFDWNTFPGYIYHSFSKDGLNWEEPAPLKVDSSSPEIYISGSSDGSQFGEHFDVLIDGNKAILAIASPEADPSGVSNAGEIYIVTGTLENDQWKWSNKNLIFTGSVSSAYSGQGLSLMSCSTGYQVYFREKTAPSTDNNLSVINSFDGGETWEKEKVIVSSPAANVTSYMTGIKAINYNNKSYVFYAIPDESLFDTTGNGGVYVAISSDNNQWPDKSSVTTKLIYSRNFKNDRVTRSRVGSEYHQSITAYVGDDERLYYSFVNPTTNSDLANVELIIGNTGKDDDFQDYEKSNYLVRSAEDGNLTAVAVSQYSVGGYSLPIFYFTEGTQKVRVIKNNLFTEFSLKVSDTDKFYKHAALEPFMAPGILFNTIKSGLAVDWPCVTGSDTAIVPYGGKTIINSYYPKSIEMANFSGSYIQESMNGNLKSNIEYRVPFENILFPGEAFVERNELKEDLVRRTTLSILPDGDPLLEFINGTYIYGGYEPYISPVDFADFNNLGPKRFSVPFVYRKAGSQDSGLYTLAMSNFLAESVKFFLKGQKMTTFVSNPDYRWKEFNSNKTYYMDLVLEKSPELVMMEAYHSELHPIGPNGEKMNGRYFGYPTNKTDKALWGGAQFTEEERRLIHNDPAYAPYTPPYFEGVARARISFKPNTDRNYSLQEIFDQSSVENIFLDIKKGASTDSDALKHAMPINSSIDIFGSTQAVEVTIDEITGTKTVREMTDSQNWVISPRMETPILDFSKQETKQHINNYSKTSGFGRGMWSGYGELPKNGKGVKIRLEYPFSTIASPLSASLLDQIGLKSEEKNIGEIAETKPISEAILVIPYVDQSTRNAEHSLETKNSTNFEFIKISKDIFSRQLANLRENKPAVSSGDVVSGQTIEETIQSTSITQMIEKMEKYIIPPEMNFLQYEDIEPFVIYLFEFNHVLDQEDLSDIWQGLMPKISYTAEEEDIIISHKSAPYEFFEGKEIPNNLRWMVFKVKKKAEFDYFKVTSNSKDDERFNFNKIIGREKGTDVYSYNWPYDFFSLVELAKVELELKYDNKENE